MPHLLVIQVGGLCTRLSWLLAHINNVENGVGVVHGKDNVVHLFTYWLGVNDIQCLPYVSTSIT